MIPFLHMSSAIRRQTLQHPGELSRGDQAVRLWCERTAHRLHGQLLRWNTLLHVGESARAPTSSSRPIPTFLSSSLLVLVSPTLCLRFLRLVLILLPRGWGLANTRAMLSHTFPPTVKHLVGMLSKTVSFHSFPRKYLCFRRI